jgi:hypothetical protein
MTYYPYGYQQNSGGYNQQNGGGYNQQNGGGYNQQNIGGYNPQYNGPYNQNYNAGNEAPLFTYLSANVSLGSGAYNFQGSDEFDRVLLSVQLRHLT